MVAFLFETKSQKVKIENTKDQVVGRTKEGFGDASNNEELELKGKFKSSAADAKKKLKERKDGKE